MSRHDRWMELAIEIAKANDNKQHKHGAVLVANGRVLAVGLNTERRGFFPSRHAEWHAIREHLDSKGILYVARIRKNGTIGPSKPCTYCMNQLVNYSQVRDVFYTVDAPDWLNWDYNKIYLPHLRKGVQSCQNQDTLMNCQTDQ